MLVDSHCHLSREYTAEIVEEALEADVLKLINIGTSIKDNLWSEKVSEMFANVYGSVGIYPREESGKSIDELEAALKEVLNRRSKKIVAVGECGIDISNSKGGRSVDEQVELFSMQLRLANDYQLPIVVHNRNGDKVVLDLLKKYYPNKPGGVVHCYTSNWVMAEQLLELGLYISFSGIVTYKNVDYELLEVVEKIPADRYLLETDSPYLAPGIHRGQKNHPRYVKITAEKIADIRNSSFTQVSEESSRNAHNLFSLGNLYEP